MLTKRNANILGVIFCGEENEASEQLIMNYSGLKLLGRVAQEEEISKEIISSYSELFKEI